MVGVEENCRRCLSHDGVVAVMMLAGLHGSHALVAAELILFLIRLLDLTVQRARRWLGNASPHDAVHIEDVRPAASRQMRRDAMAIVCGESIGRESERICPRMRMSGELSGLTKKLCYMPWTYDNACITQLSNVEKLMTDATPIGCRRSGGDFVQVESFAGDARETGLARTSGRHVMQLSKQAKQRARRADILI